MVNTAISDICSSVVLNPADAKITEGRAAADCYPGQFVIIVSGAWTKADSDTAAHKLRRGGIVVYRVRKNNDDGTPTIDAVYDIDNEPYTDKIGVCTEGFCAAFIDDQSATVYPQIDLIASDTAGNLTIQKQADTGATSGTAFRSVVVATLARKVVSGDTKAVVALGKFMGQIC